MTVRDLRYLGDPILRTQSEPVTRFDDALAALIDDLIDTVQLPGRAGLAANQIGSGLAAFSYNVDGQLGYVINPRIVSQDGEQDGSGGLPVDSRSGRGTAPVRIRSGRGCRPARRAVDRRRHRRTCAVPGA